MNARRLEAVRQQAKALGLDALLVTFLPHIRYLTGFSGSNALVFLTRRENLFITDGRYRRQSAEEVRGFRRLIAPQSLFLHLSECIHPSPGFRIGVDQNHLTLAEFRNFKRLFRKQEFVSVGSVPDPIAAIKESSELKHIKRAIAISEKVFRKILPLIRPGAVENDISAEISYWHKRFGAESDAFEPIVASGERGALPHARATARKIRRGDLVTLDFGCRVNGYHSDITRTVAVGKVSTELKRIYEVVRSAQQKALDEAHAGMTGKNLDAVAREEIARRGWGRYFMHSLGHGLGLQVHEAPRVSALSRDILAAGHVVTIEPGVYVAGLGGVRIEDDIVIRRNGCEVLTTLPRTLLSL